MYEATTNMYESTPSVYTPTSNVVKRGRPRNKNPFKTKRYNLVLPTDLYLGVKGIADTEHTSVLEAFKRIIRHGLLIHKIMQDSSSQLIIKQGESEREIILA